MTKNPARIKKPVPTFFAIARARECAFCISTTETVYYVRCIVATRAVDMGVVDIIWPRVSWPQ